MDVAQLYSRLQVGLCIMNYIISLYEKNDCERRQFVSLDILYCYLLFIIACKLN